MGRKEKTISTDNATGILLGDYLRIARHDKKISLTQMAILLNYTKGYLSGVETNIKPASKELVEKYEKALDISGGKLIKKYFPEKIEKLATVLTLSRSLIENIPYERNLFFTGREELLDRLYMALHNEKSASRAQALCGLGGVGKTQVALEYVYRYYNNYEAILWINADSCEQWLTDVRTIAHLLNVPEYQEQEHSILMREVRDWLYSHQNWLLVLDNTNEFSIVRELLPIATKGHVLITTRSQTIGGIAQCINVKPMDLEEGAFFLLRRAAILGADVSFESASEQDQLQAREIVHFMHGLPLALDQAGTYIDETQCRLDTYLSLFQLWPTRLLGRRGKHITGHPASVAATWSLSFEMVQQTNPVAADLLSLCAFLDPDSIPEEIFTEGAAKLDSALRTIHEDPLVFNEAIAELLNYSLIRRNPNHTLTIHRLVQTILKDRMSQETQYLWVERAVRVIGYLFSPTDDDGLLCSWLAQAKNAAALVKQWNIQSPEATNLLDSLFVYEQVKYPAT